MGRSRILLANWYDYPQYYDIAFQAYTLREADFIVAACRKYCPFAVRRFLEPACGSGRLFRELVARGYQLTGFDLSQPALSYLRFFFNDTATTEIYTLSLHDALPI